MRLLMIGPSLLCEYRGEHNRGAVPYLIRQGRIH